MIISQIRRLLDSLLATFLVSLSVFMLARAYLSAILPLTLVLGLFAFIFVPGYIATTILCGKAQISLDVLGYSLIFGLAVQMLVLAIDFILNAIIRINFQVVLIGGTIIAVAVLRIVAAGMGIRRGSLTIRFALRAAFRSPITYVFILALVLRIAFSSVNVTSIAPDGSLYVDIARTAASTGKFGASILNDAIFPANPYLDSQGLIPHVFVTFALALFFGISGFSMTTAVWLVIIVGSLVVYPVYSLAQRLFGKGAALFASFLLAINPLFLLFSSILYGPEITGLLFLLSAIYVLVEGAERNSTMLVIIAGTLFGVSEGFWYPYLYFALPTMVITLFLFNRSYHQTLSGWKVLFACALPVAFFTLGLKVESLYFVFLPIVIGELLVLAYASRLRSGLLTLSLSLPAGVALVTLPFAIRSYITPLQVTPTVNGALAQGLVPSIVGAFTTLLQGPFLQGITNSVRYLYYLTTPALLVLLGLSFAAGHNSREKAILGTLFAWNLILMSLTPPPGYPLYLFSFARFFLLPAALATIGASFIVRNTIAAESKRSLPGMLKAFNRVDAKRAITVGIVFCVILAFFIQLYPQAENSIAAQNPLQEFGWSSNMLSWIRNQNGSHSVIITSRPRELNLFTDRTTVDISSLATPLNEINFSQFDTMITEFNVSYVQVDEYFASVIPGLSDLYQSISLPLGTTIVPTPVLEYSLVTGNESDLQAYELVEKDTGPRFSDGIWKVVPSSSIFLDSAYRDNLSLLQWGAGNNGSLTSENGSAVLTIGQNWNYTYTFHRTPLNLTFAPNQTPAFIWNLTGIQGAHIDRIEIWSTNGTRLQSILPPGTVGIWLQYLDAGNIGDIRIVITGMSGDHIDVGWIGIVTVEVAPK